MDHFVVKQASPSDKQKDLCVVADKSVPSMGHWKFLHVQQNEKSNSTLCKTRVRYMSIDYGRKKLIACFRYTTGFISLWMLFWVHHLDLCRGSFCSCVSMTTVHSNKRSASANNGLVLFLRRPTVGRGQWKLQRQVSKLIPLSPALCLCS